MMRHVNHPEYLSYAELARLKCFDDILGTNTDWHLQNGLIMARTEADYRSAIEYNQLSPDSKNVLPAKILAGIPKQTFIRSSLAIKHFKNYS